MRMGRLTQQYAVDQWAKIEGSRLQWARLNKESIRAEKYQGLLDAVHAGDIAKVGTKIVLPPTIYGSPRFYAESFQNATAIVRSFGKPDLFITFTCNPKWVEITSALYEGEHACDRPDLTARVFKMKFDALMDDLIKGQVFGEVRAYTCTIEFQKRGLPHVHILLILSNDCMPNSPEKIDQIVCAEIPNKDKNPVLHSIVTSNNTHGPCGAVNPSSPCMEGGLPPHRLLLRKHCIIMLIRNLDPQNGHCNGTRYIVEKLHSHIIDATVAVDPHKGKRIFIPRIPMVPSDNIYPFSMRRKQFPVKPAFAVTSNKAQGQTLKAVGVYLQEPFFSHGQLYVALSRVGNKDNIKIYAPKDRDFNKLR
ncbi:ATP-dependent DNA helicase pif1 [Elysia marginata]|uniref:ATP-dependent DNA helicase pif1 n=1 Tax=Elysia marginata TaxID=1093978 RepID=A0AAV4G0E7_9GAST|nr:ATP-dependent DNA helicase pif1 [Elysia marginata]